MVSCDKCKKRFHFWCLDVPISKPPKANQAWYCYDCVEPPTVNDQCTKCPNTRLVEGSLLRICIRCGANKPIDRTRLLWKEVEDTPDTYAKDAEDSNKNLVNNKFAFYALSLAYKRVSFTLGDIFCIFVLDGKNARTFAALNEVFSLQPLAKFSIACANNTVSALDIR